MFRNWTEGHTSSENENGFSLPCPMCDEQSPMLREGQFLPGAIGVKKTAYPAAAWGQTSATAACTVV